MTRPVRVHFEGAVFHVYNRLARGERVFDQEAEAQRFAGLLREVTQRDGLTVFAWCLLGNHYHLAAQVGSVPLERPIRSLQQRTTRGVNARQRVFGPLWQGRYKAKLVDGQRYLDQLLIYIHLNPVVAGLVKDPAEYRWSGHRALLGLSASPIVDLDSVLRLFGKTRRSARKSYQRQLKIAMDAEWIGEMPGQLPWWRLGRPKKEDGDDPEVAYREKMSRVQGGFVDRPTLDVDEFIAHGSEALGVPMVEIQSRLRGEAVVRAREALAIVGVERYGLRCVDLAIKMAKSPDSVTKAISRATRRRLINPEYVGELDNLDEAVAKSGWDLKKSGTA